MFKKSALTAALVLGVTTAASAGQLTEWDGFATATKTPVTAYARNIDWNNPGGNSGAYQLTEWNNFATATKTPVAAYSRNVDWNNLGGNSDAYKLAGWSGFGEATATPKKVASDVYSFRTSSTQSTYQLPEFNGFGDKYEAPVIDASNKIDWSNLYQS